MEQKLRQINDISLGNNLRNLRNAANLTQEQVVAQLQLRNLPTTRSIYSQIEAGTYNIKISELIALSIPISIQFLMDYPTTNNPGLTVLFCHPEFCCFTILLYVDHFLYNNFIHSAPYPIHSPYPFVPVLFL